MKKIQLKLDTLRVESFETQAEGGTRGTVEAREGMPSWGGNCTETTCPPNYCFCTEWGATCPACS